LSAKEKAFETAPRFPLVLLHRAKAAVLMKSTNLVAFALEIYWVVEDPLYSFQKSRVKRPESLLQRLAASGSLEVQL
jgi:hypothetical protein